MTTLDTPPSDTTPSAHDTADQPHLKGFSCVLCAQRKVKCDKLPGGCANCTKARVACIYKAPPPPRRRKKGVRNVDTATRLRLYEEALRRLGVDPEEVAKGNSNLDQARHNGYAFKAAENESQKLQSSPEAGVLVSGDGKSRYLENGIWTSLTGEFRETQEILDEESKDDTSSPKGMSPQDISTLRDETLLFSIQSSSVNLLHFHPEPVAIFKLWQLFLDNINPLIKLFHAPTVQQIISDASGHLSELPRNVEALLFAMYCITTSSLSDGDCITILGQSKSGVTQRFRFAAQCALVNASLLRTSDMVVLQAFVLFISSLQNYDARIIWHFSGIAQRIAQRLGLHRDGDKLKLPPFEVEMRRRLWWQIMMQEGYAQKLAGTGTATSILMGDVKMPANVNDSDLFPGMKEPPKEHDGATEMMFFLIRANVGSFLQHSASTHTAFDGTWHRMSSGEVSIVAKDKAIDDLETLFQNKFLRFCDTSIPSHFMCDQLGRTVIKMMRFLAHSAEYHGGAMSEIKKDKLFMLALEVINAQNLAYTMKEMQGYMWHVNLHFQWKAFIHLIGELRHRTTGTQVEQAWKEIEKAYDFHPSLDQELARRALPIAVSNLTLKAWESHIEATGVPTNGEPYFIRTIRNIKSRTTSKVSKAPENTNQPTPEQGLSMEELGNVLPSETVDIDFEQMSGWNASDLSYDIGASPMLPDIIPLDDPENMDWSTWNTLVADFQMHPAIDLEVDFSAATYGPD